MLTGLQNRPPLPAQNGFYHWNASHARYNDRRWISGSLERQAQQAQPGGPAAEQPGGAQALPLEQQQGEQQQGEQQHQAQGAAAAEQGLAGPRRTAAGGAGSVLLPDHLRLVITPALAACLVGQASGGSSEGAPPGAPPPDWPELFRQARLEAQQGRWLKPPPPHERAAAAGGSKRSTEAGDGTSTPTGPPEPAAPRTPEPAAPALAALAAPPRRRAVAWTIPADSESEQEEAWWRWAAGSSSCSREDTSRQGGQPADRRQQAAPQQQPDQRPEQQDSWQRQQQPAGQAAEPWEVGDAGEAWRRLTQCSVVVGMHPDQATGAPRCLGVQQGLAEEAEE